MKSATPPRARGPMVSALPLPPAGLRGDRIRYTVTGGTVSQHFSGRVHGNTIDGAACAAGSPDVRWSASRRCAA